jgi:hypothetical protein
VQTASVAAVKSIENRVSAQSQAAAPNKVSAESSQKKTTAENAKTDSNDNYDSTIKNKAVKTEANRIGLSPSKTSIKPSAD